MKRLEPSTLAACAFLALICAPVAARQEAARPKPGELGYQPPEVEDVLVPDAIAHQDTSGGSLQVLLGLAGAKDHGFGAVWRDTRDGTIGLYFARLDVQGKVREPERSICSPHTMRRTDAVVVLGPDGYGTVAWTAVLGRGSVPFLRCFDAAGMLLGGERRLSTPLEASQGDSLRGGRGDDEASCREPALASLAVGRTAVVWVRAGRLQWLDVSRDGDPFGSPTDLDPTQPAAEAGVRLAVAPGDVVACLWRTSEGEARVTLRKDRRAVTNVVGRGWPRGISADPRGGYWALLLQEGRSRVVHLGVDGQPDRPPIEFEDGRDPKAEWVAFEGGVALLERPIAADKSVGEPRVWLFDENGAIQPGSPFPVTSALARGVTDPKLAAAGSQLLVAWTDTREGDANVYARSIDTRAAVEARLGVEQRVNTDQASANQNQAAVASEKDRGVMVWTDDRGSLSRIFMRRFSTAGFVGDEQVLPVVLQGEKTAPALGGLRPAVALQVDGDALIAWRTAGERDKNRLVAQVIGFDGQAKSAVLEIDDGTQGVPLDAAVTAAGARGFAIAWSRNGKGTTFARLVSADHTPGSTREIAAPRPTDGEAWQYADVDLAELESGRLLAAWTIHRGPGACMIRGRFLSDTLAPLGEEIVFEATDRGNDWDPAIAASLGGGFVMSWTSGSSQDLVRDTVVRSFDGRGRPNAPVLSVSFPANEQDFSDVVRLQDGSFAIAWEDDISYYDQVYVRRLSRDGRTLGPMMRINALETEFLPDRVAPRLAPLGAGFVAVYCDRHRSLGFDALFKRVGPAFDGARKR